MKKILLLCFFVLFIFVNLSAQRVSWSFNGNYHTELESFGVGTQVILPVYKGLAFAPNITYYFEKELSYTSDSYLLYSEGHVKTKGIDYGLDVHYIFDLEESDASISPFIGIAGTTLWHCSTGYNRSVGFLAGGGTSTSINKFENRKSVTAAAFANIGIAGRWSFVNKFFINTQAKYSIATDEYWDSYFTLTAGVGYRF